MSPIEMPPPLWVPARPAILRAANEEDIRRALLVGTLGACSVRGLRASKVLTWQTAWSETVNLESGATFSSYTLVQVVPSAKIVLTGGAQVRVRFKAGSGGYGATKAYIYEGASSGDAIDAAATPTQLLFSGGSAGFTIGANATIKSDGIGFTIPAGKNLCVAWETPAVAYPHMYGNPGGYTAGWNYKSGADSVTVDKTGYARYQDVGGIDLIETLQ
jgi:hypothetical protein